MVLIALDGIWDGSVGLQVPVWGRGGGDVVRGRRGERPPRDSGGLDGRDMISGSVVLVTAAEGRGAALGVLAPVVAARPLAVDKEARMVDTLQYRILPAVYTHTHTPYTHRCSKPKVETVERNPRRQGLHRITGLYKMAQRLHKTLAFLYLYKMWSSSVPIYIETIVLGSASLPSSVARVTLLRSK